jgi:SagB-type dehydrogenase family enzyme
VPADLRAWLRLVDGVHIGRADGELVLILGDRGERVGFPEAAAREVLARLAAEPCTENELRETVRAAKDDPAVARLPELLDRLRQGGWLMTTVEHTGRRLLTICPTGPHPVPRRAAAHNTLRLSRFALLRRGTDDLILESPLAPATVRLHDPAVVALLHAFARAKPVVPVSGALPPNVIAHAVDELAWYGFLVGPDDEDDRLASSQWSTHELWFHARSRSAGPVGSTYWAHGMYEPLPARRPAFPGQPIALRRPDLAAIRAADPPFTAVLEERRTVRHHDDVHPLTVDQLGEFLYRCAGVRWIDHDGRQEVCGRPYPAGGSLHELELYPLVTAVSGLVPGMYHYDSFDHTLEPVPARAFAVDQLVQLAAAAADQSARPQVLIVITARFGRIMWKYQAMGYALVLTHVGVLYQTMYTVATAMGLAPCAIGAGGTDLFNRATGLDYLAESAVGEFLLGSRRGLVAGSRKD